MFDRTDIVVFQIRSFNNLIKRDIDKAMFKHHSDNVNGVHGWAISYFYDNSDKKIFQKDFESAFSIRRSTATNILKLMEKKGLIVRESVANDARLKKITLTEKGYNINSYIEQDIIKREKKLKNGLDDEEIKLFFNIIEKMKGNLRDNND